MTTAKSVRRRLASCPAGRNGWREFEDACLDALRYLFVPPLQEPIVQPRTYSGIDRRDAVFPNRITDPRSNWGFLYHELAARMILVEFKNYDREEIGKDETNQTRNYLRPAMGRLALMCCNRLPNEAAHIKRNTIYSDEKKVILFVTGDHICEMLSMKERRREPSDVIMDLIERFYLEHE